MAIAAALVATAVPSLSHAQDAGGDAALENGVIVVTGYRASLENAVNNKKSAELIVESVSAEDIGKLPDASIAESIARLPGLTSQRLSGRSNAITIRGFAPDFSTTLLNGREQTSTGDNRAVEYDQYPAEVVSAVNVYKTPMATLIGQGLSGTVDMRAVPMPIWASSMPVRTTWAIASTRPTWTSSRTTLSASRWAPATLTSPTRSRNSMPGAMPTARPATR